MNNRQLNNSIKRESEKKEKYSQTVELELMGFLLHVIQKLSFGKVIMESEMGIGYQVKEAYLIKT